MTGRGRYTHRSNICRNAICIKTGKPEAQMPGISRFKIKLQQCPRHAAARPHCSSKTGWHAAWASKPRRKWSWVLLAGNPLQCAVKPRSTPAHTTSVWVNKETPLFRAAASFLLTPRKVATCLGATARHRVSIVSEILGVKQALAKQA